MQTVYSSKHTAIHYLIGMSLIFVSATSFGAMSIFAHFAYASGASVTTVLFLRYTIAAVVLNLFVISRKLPLPRGRNRLGLIGIGAIGFVSHSLCFFSALLFASPGLVGLLLYLYPTLVMLITIVFLKERSTLMKLLALGLASTGTALTVGLTATGQGLGVLLGVAAAIVYAVHVVASSQILRSEAPIPACTMILTSAAIVFGGIVWIQGAQFPTTLSGWLAIGAIALISTVLAVTTLFAGIKWLGSVNASTLSTIEPLVTIILAFLVLHQPIQPWQLFGGGLILAAVIVLAKDDLKESTLDRPLKPQK